MLHSLHRLPHELLLLSRKEKAFLYASIEIEAEKQYKLNQHVKDGVR